MKTSVFYDVLDAGNRVSGNYSYTDTASIAGRRELRAGVEDAEASSSGQNLLRHIKGVMYYKIVK
jgi:hypothetical protein